MDILKKAVLLVAILSIALFMPGCGGGDEEGATGDVTPEDIEEAEEARDEAVQELKDRFGVGDQ